MEINRWVFRLFIWLDLQIDWKGYNDDEEMAGGCVGGDAVHGGCGGAGGVRA